METTTASASAPKAPGPLFFSSKNNYLAVMPHLNPAFPPKAPRFQTGPSGSTKLNMTATG